MPTPLTTLSLEKSNDIARLRDVTMALADVLGFATFERTRTVTAVLELGRNAIEHGKRGRARFAIIEIGGKPALQVTVLDQGAGIPDAALAGSAGPAGAGLGLGLRGVQRIAERFDVETSAEGTKIEAAFLVPDTPQPASALIPRAADALLGLEASDPAVQLASQNRELMAALADRDLLMKELHHRTRNNLALIVALVRMSRQGAKSDETVRILKELETRVGSLAKSHELMQAADDAKTIPAETLLRDVASNAERAFNLDERQVHIVVRSDPVELEGRIAVDLGLIVGELITNAYKHAFDGREKGVIEVDLARMETGELCLRVKDDGPGLPEDAPRPERSRSLGWQLIRTLTFQHDGTLNVDGRDGLSVEIVFDPVEKAATPDTGKE